jgi:hypothetical protein
VKMKNVFSKKNFFIQAIDGLKQGWYSQKLLMRVLLSLFWYGGP